jgi:hypothetical protein
MGEFEKDFQELGTSPQEINSWEENHKEELEEYFTKNPKVEKQIEALKQKFENIMQGNIENRESNNQDELNIETAAKIMIKVMQSSIEIVSKQWAPLSKKTPKKDKRRELGRLKNEVQNDPEIEAIYEKFGTDGKKFDAFMKSGNNEKVQDYVNKHPDLKAIFEDSMAKFNELSQL